MTDRLQDPGLYGWSPANENPDEWPVPDDLVPYYRMFRDGYFGYICPCCRCVWAPGWGQDTPKHFRAHLQPYIQGKGCFFEPKAQPAVAGKK